MKLKDRNYGWILFAVLLTHGLLLLNDGIYWDSWMPEYAASIRDLYLTVQPFRDTGVPFDGYFYYLMGQLPFPIFGYKLLTFISILSTACFFYSLARRSGFLTQGEALSVAVAGVLFPAYRVHAADVLTPYCFATSLVFLSAWVLVKKEEEDSIPVLIRLIIWLILAFAFLLYSPLLVFFYGFLFFWLLLWRKKNRGVLQFIFRRFDFGVLPIAVYLASQKLFPAAPQMSQNYNIKFDWNVFKVHAWNFLEYGVRVPLRASFKYFALFVFLIGLGLGFVFLRKKILETLRKLREYHSKNGILGLFVFSLILFVSSSLAYILVGKSPDPTFWWERMSLLIPWSVALMFLCVHRLFTKYLGSGRFIFIWLAFLGVVTVGAWFRHQASYWMLQARWISYQSVARNLSANPHANEITFFHVDETAFTVDAGYQFHTSYTWSVMMTYFGWGKEDKAFVGGLPFQYVCKLAKNDPLSARRFAMSQVDPQGKQAHLMIRNGPSAPYGKRDRHWVHLSLLAEYYYYKFFNSGTMSEFLGTVTELEIRPIQNPETCSG